jgi:hypothetical protein
MNLVSLTNALLGFPYISLRLPHSHERILTTQITQDTFESLNIVLLQFPVTVITYQEH